MHTIEHLCTRAILAGLLVTGYTSAIAVPVIEAHSGLQTHKPKPPASGMGNCVGQPVTAERSKPNTAWNGGDDAPLSSRAQRALNGGGKNDLDSYTGRCRLADANHDASEPLNDGLDPDKLLAMLDEMADGRRTLSTEEEQALLDKMGNNVHVELDSTDNELHAYIGDGLNRQDLGQLARLDLQQAEDDGLIVLRFDQSDGRYAQGNRRQAGDQAGGGALIGLGSTAAIPEPATYLMLLSGLALVGLVRLRRRGA
ncbi:PEP-CTERM sorting domain-containing protein [Duganella hordei]|uniref:PEP-CTERM sorting domain-containing protein n=1 Tax=Duganella hordei TaxID=2865934 RepID=UPI0030E94683